MKIKLLLLLFALFLTGCSQPAVLTQPCVVSGKRVSSVHTNLCIYSFSNLSSYNQPFRPPRLFADVDLADVGDTVQCINGVVTVTKRAGE